MNKNKLLFKKFKSKKIKIKFDSFYLFIIISFLKQKVKPANF